MAHELGHPVYDCLYLALAEREQALVVTADRVFAASRRRLAVEEPGRKSEQQYVMPAGGVAGSRPKGSCSTRRTERRIHAAGWRRGDGGAQCADGARRAALQVRHIAGLAHLVRLAAADGDEDAVAGVLYVRPAQRGDFRPPRR